MNLVSFIFFLIFYFIFYLFSIFLFIELRVRVGVMISHNEWSQIMRYKKKGQKVLEEIMLYITTQALSAEQKKNLV